MRATLVAGATVAAALVVCAPSGVSAKEWGSGKWATKGDKKSWKQKDWLYDDGRGKRGKGRHDDDDKYRDDDRHGKDKKRGKRRHDDDVDTYDWSYEDDGGMWQSWNSDPWYVSDWDADWYAETYDVHNDNYDHDESDEAGIWGWVESAFGDIFGWGDTSEVWHSPTNEFADTTHGWYSPAAYWPEYPHDAYSPEHPHGAYSPEYPHGAYSPEYPHDNSYEEETTIFGGLLEMLFDLTGDMTDWGDIWYGEDDLWATPPHQEYEYGQDVETWYAEHESWFEEPEGQMSAEDEMLRWLDTMVEEAIYGMESGGDAPPVYEDWLHEDAAWIQDRHDNGWRDGDRDYVPFGAFAAGLPWVTVAPTVNVNVNVGGDAAPAGPAVISVDMSGVHGMDHTNLTGAFSSCLSRQDSSLFDGAFGGLFSSVVRAYNDSDTGVFSLDPFHVADAVGGVDLECVLYAFVGGNGTHGHGFGGGKRGVGKGPGNANLPPVHVPRPCPTDAAQHGAEWRPHCAMEGEVVEVMGSFGVSVPETAATSMAASGEPTTVSVDVADPVTGTTYTIDVTVSAKPASNFELDTKVVSSTAADHSADGNLNVDPNGFVHDFPNDEGEPESIKGVADDAATDTATEAVTDFETLYWRLREKHDDSVDSDKKETPFEGANALMWAGIGGAVGLLIGAVAFWRKRAHSAEARRAPAAMVLDSKANAMRPGGANTVVIAMPASAMASAEMAEKAVIEALPAAEC